MINTAIPVIVKGNNTASITIKWSYRSSNGVMVWQHQWNVVHNTQPYRENISEDSMIAVAGW